MKTTAPGLRFDRNEISGALGDLGTLLPLAPGLIYMCGIPPVTVFGLTGAFYILTGLFYRIPLSVQSLKAVSVIALSMGLGRSHIAAAGLTIGGIMIILSLTGIVDFLSKYIRKSFIRGIQIGVGLMLVIKGGESALGGKIFFGRGGGESFSSCIMLSMLSILIIMLCRERFPSALIVVITGLGLGFLMGGSSVSAESGTTAGFIFPSPEIFGAAFLLLVLPQLPVTPGNAVYGSSDLCMRYYGGKGRHTFPRNFAGTIGIFDLTAGLLGGMPVCHGSGGVAAHNRFGARTGGSVVSLGGILLILPLAVGEKAFLTLLGYLPAPMLGVMLLLGGVQMLKLVSDLEGWSELTVAGITSSVTALTKNAAFGIACGAVSFAACDMIGKAGYDR